MLSRKYRITKEYVEKVIKFGKGPNFDVFYVRKMSNNLENRRFSVIVSKKIEKTSVGRHLIKRRIWSIIEKIDENELSKNEDVVIFVKKIFSKDTLLAIKQDLLSALKLSLA